MQDLEAITNVDHLRDLARVYQRQVALLVARIGELTRELAALRSQDGQEAIQLELEQLTRELKALQESHPPEGPRGRGEPRSRSKPQTGHGPTAQPKLPTQESLHLLDEPDQTCPSCGGELEPFEGQFETSEEITYEPPKITLLVHKRQKYVCSCGGCVDTALGPVKLIPGGRYSVAFATAVAGEKYLDHLPLERQVRRFGRQGLEVTAQALFDQLWAAAQVLLPTYGALFERLRKESVLYLDDTGWKMMKPHDVASWHLWNLNAGRVSWYTLSSTKGAPVVNLLLGNYAGIVVGDGAPAYTSVQKDGGRGTDVDAFQIITPGGELRSLRSADLVMEPAPFRLGHCWAHVQRKFRDASKNFYRHARAFMDQVKLLYQLEDQATATAKARAGPDATAAELHALLLQVRREVRDTQSRPITQAMLDWLKTPRALPRSALGQAIAYALGRWKGLTLFLDHPEMLLDNNRSERALRGPVVGRKNFAGCRSERGALVAAVFYSLFETAKLCGVDPVAYVHRAVECALLEPGAVTLPEPLLGS